MILGITPARGGSKGIPKKNIKEICGKPLIAWTIEAAKKSKLLDRYVVSTEDREITRIARKYSAEVIDRPKELARDEIPTLPVLQDVLKKINADTVVWLQCTSPVRDDGLIDDCIKRFLDSGADSLATGFICKLYEWGKYDQVRQNLKAFFHDDGNIYVMKADLIKKGTPWGKKMEKVIISKEQNFEIEDEFDFWLNEQILKKRLSENKKKNNINKMRRITKIIPKPIRLIFKKIYRFLAHNWLGNLIIPRKSREEIHQYWRQPGDKDNNPEVYIVPTDRSEFLFKFITEYVNSKAKILEIGCNVGRNLNYLFNVGYKNLEGVEISEEAIDLMRKTYPEMTRSIKVYNNSIEEMIKNFKNNSFDLVFTMAILQHIHPDGEFIFPEIVRITKKYLITVENEKAVDWRHFPRNYKKIFEPLGLKQIQQCKVEKIKSIGFNYWLRVFQK